MIKGGLAIAILKRSTAAKVALEKVGIILDPLPPPPTPPKIEVTYKELENMLWKEVKEDVHDDFQPNMIYDVGNSDSEDEELFNYFNPKKDKKVNSGMSRTNRTTKTSRTKKSQGMTQRSIISKTQLKQSTNQGEADPEQYYTEGNTRTKLKKGKSQAAIKFKEDEKRLNPSKSKLKPIKNQSMLRGPLSQKSNA